MPVDIALHALGNKEYGNHPPAPSIVLLDEQVGLAENTNSKNFIVNSREAVMVLTATTKLRVDITKLADVGGINPATSAIVLPTDTPRIFHVPEGTWIVKTAIYA